MILLDSHARPVIGHRGAAAYAPENTVASFQLALDLGAEALELDIRRSADGEAVVCHDPTLDRTTDRVGLVSRLSLAQIQQADAGFRFSSDGGTTHSFRGAQVTVPSLRQVLQTFPATPLLIEIKEIAVQEEVARLLRETGAADRAVVAGADRRALVAFRSAPFLLGGSRRDITALRFGLGRPDSCCRVLAVPDRYHGLLVPNSGMLRRARVCGCTVHVWTVDDPAWAGRLWDRGVNGIVTNAPDLIRTARDRQQPPATNRA